MSDDNSRKFYDLSRELDKLLIRFPQESELMEFKQNLYRRRTAGTERGKDASDKQAAALKKFGTYISALANAAALKGVPKAYLIIGVDDHGTITGTDFSIYDRVSNQDLIQWLSQHLSSNASFYFDEFCYRPQAGEIDPGPSRKIVLLTVAAAVAYPVAWDKVRYFRKGSAVKILADFPTDEAQLWSNLKGGSYGLQIAKAGLSGEEVEDLLNIQQYFALLRQPMPKTIEERMRSLEQERMVRTDGRKWSITNAGALLLARDLNQFDQLSYKCVKMVWYSTNSKAADSSAELWPEGYASGCAKLLERIAKVYPRMEHICSDGIRRERPYFSWIALREVVVNAMVHQVLDIPAGPMIEAFPAKLVITSYGAPFVRPSRFIDLMAPWRNPDLAGFMIRAGLCESRGSGIDKAVMDTEQLHQAPMLIEDLPNDAVRVTLYPEKDFSEMDLQERLRACYQHCCLCREHGENMTNSSLRERFNLPAARSNTVAISKLLQEAVRLKMIAPADPNSAQKNRSYVPAWALAEGS